MKTFHLTIATLGEHLFDGEAVSASFPGVEGVFEILAGHEPFVSELKAGQTRVVAENGETYHITIPEGGIAEVSHNHATVLL